MCNEIIARFATTRETYLYNCMEISKFYYLLGEKLENQKIKLEGERTSVLIVQDFSSIIRYVHLSRQLMFIYIYIEIFVEL